jgi:hypothetical protein
MKMNRECERVSETELEHLFVRTVDTIEAQIGPDAFRYEKTINKSLFDAVMIAIAKRIALGKPLAPRLNEKHVKLLNSYFRGYSKEGTTEAGKVKDRIAKAYEIFAAD